MRRSSTATASTATASTAATTTPATTSTTATADTTTAATTAATPNTPHPVDQRPPFGKLFILGLQHVLAMYAGAVAVPLIVGGAMVAAGKLQQSDIHHLIVADLFVAGIASIIQSVGFWKFGSRLPLIQGVSFVSVAPMIAIGSQFGVQAIYGSVITTGLIMIAVAPVFSKIVKYFPAIVTGTIMTIIGLSLMKVPAGWIVSDKMAPNLSGGLNFLLALVTLLTVVVIHRFSSANWRPMAILGGVIVGTIVAQLFGATNWTEMHKAEWIGVPTPFQFGLPTFQIGAILTMAIVGLVIMTETTGDIIAVGKITGRPASKQVLGNGLRADGLSTLLGGVFNTFPYTAFAQNVGLVSLSRVFSRFVVTASGVILIALGLLPKLGGAVAAIPTPVLGGAGIALFGMITASGIRTLASIEWNETRALIVGVSVSIALLPSISSGFYDALPKTFAMILDSGITMGAISIILLNLLLNRQGNGHVDETMGAETTPLGAAEVSAELASEADAEVGEPGGVEKKTATETKRALEGAGTP